MSRTKTHLPSVSRSRPQTRLVVISPSLPAQFVDTLQAETDISVIGQSAAASDAVELVTRLRPDVVIIELDRVGHEAQRAIQLIMRATPTPILVMAPAGTGAGSADAIEALGAGAVEAMPTPSAWSEACSSDMRRRVRVLRGVTVLRSSRGQLIDPPPSASPAPAGRRTRVIAIVASTGGPSALATIAADLRGVRAPVLVVQHMHGEFIDGLVHWMQRVGSVPVRAATHGALLERGVVYIGPGDVHLEVGPGRTIVLAKEPKTAHRPSGDQLLLSVARHVGPDGIGVVLTGMGEDGAVGLLALRQRGGLTMVQDEASSVVFGMPKAAMSAGAATHVLPLGRIGPALVKASLGAEL